MIFLLYSYRLDLLFRNSKPRVRNHPWNTRHMSISLHIQWSAKPEFLIMCLLQTTKIPFLIFEWSELRSRALHIAHWIYETAKISTPPPSFFKIPPSLQAPLCMIM